MQPDIDGKMTYWMQNFFMGELADIQIRLRQGLAIKEYQVIDTSRQAIELSLSILESFHKECDKFCASQSVKHSLEIIQESYNDRWQALPKNKCLHKLMVCIGFLAVDIQLPDEAELLFSSLLMLEPDDVNPLLGIAYTKLCIGSAHEALDVIRNKVLNNSPGNDLGLAFLSVAYNALDRPEEALAAASAVITADRDESAVTLARIMQNEIGLNAA